MNFGGFVSLSTIDWRGRAVCTVFFRGCPIRCSYCQNEGIISGEDNRDIEEIKEMIKSSSPFISGVVFSGGEPTLQREALVELARYSKKLNLDVGIQTNGLFPETLNLWIKSHWTSSHDLKDIPVSGKTHRSIFQIMKEMSVNHSECAKMRTQKIFFRSLKW